MRVAKWGNSLAIRLPSVIVDALELKEGDDIDVQIAGRRELDLERKLERKQAIARLREILKGTLPPDFKFSREEANER
jgi:antitoxin MazE